MCISFGKHLLTFWNDGECTIDNMVVKGEIGAMIIQRENNLFFCNLGRLQKIVRIAMRICPNDNTFKVLVK